MPGPMRALFATLLLLAVFTGPARAVDDAAGQERLGARVGYIQTYDGLNENFGDGWDLTLYFTEKLYKKVLLDIRLGAIYLGDSMKPEIADSLLLTRDTVTEMRFFYFSAGPMAGFNVGDSWAGYASLGIGVYSVSLGFNSSRHVGSIFMRRRRGKR
jgi:hypothetical protein